MSQKDSIREVARVAFREEPTDVRISYKSVDDDIAPGESISLAIGVRCHMPGTGWPGLPETGEFSFGVAEAFKPIKITIADGFELRAVFFGADNQLHAVDNDSKPGIPAAHLASDAPQPDFEALFVGLSATVCIKNVSDRVLTPWVKIEGVLAPSSDVL
jgi:hypothetical protein